MGFLSNLFKKPYSSISPSEAQALSAGGAYFIDVREPSEYKTGHAVSAVNIPLGALERRMGTIPKERDVLVICQSGVRSANAASALARAGFKVFNVTGGTANWRRSGLRVSK
jgi:rhodanese-related sulfurtransferase